MASQDAIRDNNHVPVALGVNSTAATETLPFKINPSTGGLLVDSSGGGFVTSINTLTGAITLAAGTGISLGTVGNTITITNTQTATLAGVSAASTTTPNSLYTMTSTIPVEFKTSGGTHLLYLDETNGRVGIGTNAPSAGLHIAINSIVSVPAELLSGTWITGGSATTNKPHLLIEPTGTASTAWSTSGTGLGINAAAAFAGDLINLSVAAVPIFRVAGNGQLNVGSSATTLIRIDTDNSIQSYISGSPALLKLNPSGGPVSITSGSLASTANALSVTGTLSSTNANQTGVNISITPQDGAATKNGLLVTLNAGTTNSNVHIANRGINNTAGIGTNSLAAGAANYGLEGEANATTNGDNVGVQGYAQSGNRSIGVEGISFTAKNSATNIGVVGLGLNTGTSPIQMGGFFGLMASAPTFASAALMADNGATTSDIFVARDNGTPVFIIADDSNLTQWLRINIPNGIDQTMAVHTGGDNAWSMRLFNDGFSTTNPIFSYYSSSDGTFSQGTDNNNSIKFYTNGFNNTRMRITGAGLVGIGVTPTAVLHLKAGTATANTAPLKFNSGTLLTTAEAGAVEFLTDAFYGTITTGAARKTFAFLESPTFTGTVTAPTIVSTATLRLKGYTVATLPAGTQGDVAFCTDLLLPAFYAIVAGGGAVVGTVFYNGTNWVAI